MATPRVKIKRDFKDPIKGMLSIVVLLTSFVFVCEIAIALVRLFIG